MLAGSTSPGLSSGRIGDRAANVVLVAAVFAGHLLLAWVMGLLAPAGRGDFQVPTAISLTLHTLKTPDNFGRDVMIPRVPTTQDFAGGGNVRTEGSPAIAPVSAARTNEPAPGTEARPPGSPVSISGSQRSRCLFPEVLPDAERAACADQWMQQAAMAAPVGGSGDPERDAGLARQGQAAIARYEMRREGLRPNSRAAPCPEGPHARNECQFAIRGRLWSSRDGWLPDVRSQGE